MPEVIKLFKKIIPLILFFSGICFSQTETTNTRPLVKRSEFKKIDLKQGVVDYNLNLTNGENWKVRISIPELLPDKEYPLALALHWAGGGDTYKEYSDCLVFPAFEGVDAIIVAPSAGYLHWIHPDNEKRVIDLILQLRKRLPVAKEKIIVTGYSNGGIGSWQYAKNNPKLFCATIPMAGYYKKGKIKIPIFAIHGKKDELFNLSEVQKQIYQSINMGSTIDFSIMNEFSHYMACNYIDILREKVLYINTTLF